MRLSISALKFDTWFYLLISWNYLLSCEVLKAQTTKNHQIVPFNSVNTPNLFPEPGLGNEKQSTQNTHSNETVLTLENSIRKAVMEGTPVLSAEYDRQYNGAQLLQAYGQFLPTFSGSANSNYSMGTIYSTAANPSYVTGAGSNASYTISTDLNIFNGLTDYAGLTSAILKSNAADSTVIRAKQQIKLDVIQNFYQVILDHKLVDIAESNLVVSRKRETLFAAQVRAGIRHLSDLFQQQAQTSIQEVRLIAARNTMLRDQLSLLKRLRLDVARRYRFVEPKLTTIIKEKQNPFIENEKNLIETALARRLDLKASATLLDAEHWDVRAARGNYLPKLDFIATLSSAAHYLDSQMVNGGSAVPVIQNNIFYQLGTQLQYTVGVTLTWNLFDRFLTQQLVSRLQTVVNKAELEVQDLKNKVEADVRQAYGDYMTVIQQFHSAEQGLNAAQKAYAVLSGRYAVGGVNILDLLTGQDVLVQAQSNYAQTLIALQLQDEALRFATGEMEV